MLIKPAHATSCAQTIKHSWPAACNLGYDTACFEADSRCCTKKCKFSRFHACKCPQVIDYSSITVIECHAMCPEADVPIDQLPPQLQEEVRRICPRISSLSSINALLWPESRRVSSAFGGRASEADIDTLILARDILQQQSDEVLAARPPLQRLRTTASINALVWPLSSRSASAHSRGSQAASVADNDNENDSRASVRSTDGGSTVDQELQQALRPLPSAEDIDDILWPGSDALTDSPALHAGQVSHSQVFAEVQTLNTSEDTAGLPESPGRRARALQTHQRSLLDKAAAKRALAALLAAAKASQIRYTFACLSQFCQRCFLRSSTFHL